MVLAYENWKRRESTRRWRTFERGSRVSRVYFTQALSLTNQLVDGNLDGYQKKKSALTAYESIIALTW